MNQLDGLISLRCLEAMPRWSCACGEPMRGARGNGLCQACTEQKAYENTLGMSRSEIFRGTRVGDVHRVELPKSAEWPRDPRAKASEIHPAEDWPSIASELVAEVARKGPRSLVIHGKNDTGKSHRAAELIVLLHRAGACGACWVTEADLAGELNRGFNFVRQHYHHALEAPVLVLDDIFSTRGNRGRVEESIGMLLDLVDRRYRNRRKITIYTTHLPLNHAEPGEATVRTKAPAIYGRMKDGLILHLAGDGHRGGWAS